jgi:hypothetical protein
MDLCEPPRKRSQGTRSARVLCALDVVPDEATSRVYEAYRLQACRLHRWQSAVGKWTNPMLRWHSDIVW